LIGLILLRKKKELPPSEYLNHVEPLEKENLLLYKTQGGLEKDQVMLKLVD
jgi:hypothetical protein